jgi:CRP-like cAMP-binding protein
VLLRAGDWWGEAALSTASGRHVATAVTATPAEVLIYDRREYRALVELCPPVARRIAGINGARPRALAPTPQALPTLSLAPAPAPTSA